MKSSSENLTDRKARSWQMFNRISPTYDMLNRLFSFGYDLNWRTQMTKFLPKETKINLLDLATGTADVLILLCRQCPNIVSAQGLDLAQKMLKIGKEKIKRANLDTTIQIRTGDAHQIPFPNESFDVVSIATARFARASEKM